jgi:hypothetical protein
VDITLAADEKPTHFSHLLMSTKEYFTLVIISPPRKVLDIKIYMLQADKLYIYIVNLIQKGYYIILVSNAHNQS